MYEELVMRLREVANDQCFIGCFGICDHCKIGEELNSAADAIEELTNNSEKVAIEYCKKRNLVMITHESFEILKSYYNRGMMPLPEPPKEET